MILDTDDEVIIRDITAFSTNGVGKSGYSYIKESLWYWRNDLAIKNIDCSSEDPGSIISTYLWAYNHW